MGGKTRLVDPLWAHAPLALLRFRGLLAAVFAGALLLVLAAASAPLYVSAATSEALSGELERLTRFGAGASLLQGSVQLRWPGQLPLEERIEETNRALERALRQVPHLERPVVTLVGPVVVPSPSAAPSPERPLRLVARTDALDHVTRLARTEGPGLWLADEAARFMEIEPGDTLFLRYELEPDPVPVRIAGIYRALWREPARPYWRSLYGYIYERNPDAGPPPTFLIGDLGQVAALSSRLRVRIVDVRRDWPLARTSLKLEEAEKTAAGLAAFHRGTQEAASAVGRAIRCVDCPSGLAGGQIEYSSQLEPAIGEARETISALRGPIDLLSFAGVLIAVAVLGSSAAFALAGRRVETTFLVAHGFGPGSVATRTVVEALLPALAGAALGYGVALVAVSALGPGAIESRALSEAARAAALALPAALALVGLVSGGVFLRATPRRPREGRPFLRRVPWEFAALAAAGYALWRLRRDGAFAEARDGEAARASWAVLAFPVLLLGAGSAVAARGLAQALARVPVAALVGFRATHLAVRRLLAAGPLAAALTAASALAVGTFVYAQTLVRSLDATAAARAHLFVGSDVQGFTSPNRAVPADLAVPATLVTKLTDLATLGPTAVDVLVVDAPTVSRTVYWDSSWADRPLPSIMEDLRAAHGNLPAVIAGDGPAGGVLRLLGLAAPLEVVGRVEAFPGISLGRTLVVVDRNALTSAAERAGVPDPRLAGGVETQVWARGDAGRVLRALEASPLRPFPVLTAAEVRRNPTIRSVTQTFGFLSALGIGTGLLVVAATLLYAQARQRSRIVAQALSGRMGLREHVQRRANVLELVSILLSGALAGVALALAAARLVLVEVDEPVRLPSGPLFRAPWAATIAALLVLAAVAGAAALLVHAQARRANVAEVLRAGE